MRKNFKRTFRKFENDAQQSCQNLTLTVGFNRRVSPHAKKMKALLATCRDERHCYHECGLYSCYTSWVHDRAVGGSNFGRSLSFY
ncbi:MAG: hypothetical protein R2822_11685 [Spirosomataceae bacterium]